MKKGMLRAAVALTLLGSVLAVPAESEAVEPQRVMDKTFGFKNSFDWTDASSFNTDYAIGIGQADQMFMEFWIHLDDSFYAYNVSSGKKLITHFYGNNGYHARFGNSGIYFYWNFAGSRVIKAAEIQGKGVSLNTEREHQVSIDYPDDYNCNVYYTVKDPSKSYIDFDASGIEWKKDETLLSLDRKFDFGTNGLSINFDSLKISNPGDVKIGDSMVLFDSAGYYDPVTFREKIQSGLYKEKDVEYKSNPTELITATGVFKTMTGMTTTSAGSAALSLNVNSNTLKTLDVDLSKIGKDTSVYKGPETEWSQDYSTNPLTITTSGSINGANIKPKSKMTLVQLQGNKITTQYEGKTIALSTESYGYKDVFKYTGSKNLDAVKFTDTSTGGVAVSGTSADNLSVEIVPTEAFATNPNYIYNLYYTVGAKEITGIGSSADGIDLSNHDGGFVADSGYTFNKTIVLDLSDPNLKFINSEKANGTFTLLDLTNTPRWKGYLYVKNGGNSNLTSATMTSAEYTVLPETNGVTAFGTKDITFSVDRKTLKKIDVTASEGETSRIQLDAVDVTKLDSAPTISNLKKNGIIDASNFSLTGISSLQAAANYTDPLTIATVATGETNKFTNWTLNATGEKEYTVYDENGITGTMAGTLNTTDGKISLSTDGLKSIAFGTIDGGNGWDSFKPVVSLTGGKLDTVDLSNLAFKNKLGTGFQFLLDASKMTGDVKLKVGDKWTENKKLTDSSTTTTYHSAWTKENESVTGAGLTLSVNRADQIAALKSTGNEGTDFTVVYTANKGFATGFSLGDGIIWKKDEGDKSYGFKLTERYDFSTLSDKAITFDASNPYALIANPAQVGEGETMTFFDAGTYMTDEEWKSKVYIAADKGQSEATTQIQDHAVTLEGRVNLEISKDDKKHTVTGTITDEYLSSVGINLSQIGKEETDTNNEWKNGQTLYSQTASKQDYSKENTSITVSGSLFGGTTDESVKTDESMTLVHIKGTNAGADGNITAFDTTKEVAFADAAANGIIATGTHTDTLKSNVSEDKSSYDLVYSVGKKTVKAFSTNNLDLTARRFQGGRTVYDRRYRFHGECE